ncbi:putative transcription factor interactor and regulator CCHC(Zn) family [Helianthus annuus]|uniref:Transcription factor interactor and regulator CCHC(Zn) family n=1 Tax=Helianthus annuus TaxID=4232 RepID=A0A9K3I7C0_HELAN|nr:putative transcription factor interactor and regulator CCHC(Zn) family [Helianthus annuus]
MNPDQGLSRSNSSFRRSSASKIDQLYEISYISDESKVPITSLPLVNPYSVFKKPQNSLSKKVKQLVGSVSNPVVKEFVQTSKFDSHQLPATTSEHLVPLTLPSDLPRICVSQGYTHIHFGAIRLALTFHGRKGLPAFSRIALVDTRFVEYQHACIGTIQTTLNAGTVFVTFYPNFNMPLNDPSLLTALKAQIQIGGTPQVNTFQATFHYQMAYRVQNHSLDIMVPGSQDNSGDALLIDIDSNATPTCTYVPKQLSREELTKLLPEKWITNYEQIHQAPVQTTTTPDFVRHQDGQVEVRFARQDRREIFSTISMLQPAEEPHFPFDVCDCQECLDEAYELEYKEETKRKKEKGSQNALKKRYEAGDPNVGLLGEPSRKFDYYVLYGDSKPKPKQTQPSRPRHPPTQVDECCMLGTTPPFPSSPGYQVEFPPLTSFEDTQQKTKHSWKIKNPTTVGATGVPESITAAEATLNWQSENAVAQNKALNAILAHQNNITKAHENLTSRVQELEGIIYEVRAKILELHHELLQLVQNSSGPQLPQGLQQKEAEMKFLKAQLADLERQHKQQRVSTYADDPWRLPTTPFVRTSFDPQPLPTSSFLHSSPSLNLWAKEQAKIKARKASSTRSTSSESTSKAVSSGRGKEPSGSKYDISDNVMMMTSTKAPEKLPNRENGISSFLQALTKTSEENVPMVAPVIAPLTRDDESSVSEESSTPQSYEEVPPTDEFEHLFMNEDTTERVYVSDIDDEASQTSPQTTERAPPNTDSKQQFTFDDVLPAKWRDRSIEMLTWCTAELQYYSIDMVIKRFLARCQGRLRDWYVSLGEYRQTNILNSKTPEEFINNIYYEFIGNPVDHTIRAREEFLKMNCCSFRPKDLEKHYNRMSERFYCLQGIDDVNLKQVFLNSFPESLANEAYRALEAKSMTVAQASLGGLYQLIKNALTKLCNQKQFLVEFEKTGRRLGSACNDKHLKIKCKDDSSCSCSKPHKKSRFVSFKKSGDYYSRSGKHNSQRRWKFLNKKSKRGRNTNRCYVCNKEGHFAKDCKNTRKTQALLEAINKVEPVDVSDIESLYSLDDEPGKRMICTISYSSCEESETSETSESEEEPLQIYMMEEGPQEDHGDPCGQSLTAAMFQKIQKSQNKQYPSLKDHVEDSLSEQFKENIPVADKGISQKSKDEESGPREEIMSGHKGSLLRKKGKTTKEVIWVKKETGKPSGRERRGANHTKPATGSKQKMQPRSSSSQEIPSLQESCTAVQEDKEKILKDSLPDDVAYLKASKFKNSHNPNTSIPKEIVMDPLIKKLQKEEVPEEIIEVVNKHAITDESLLNYKNLLTLTFKTQGPLMDGDKFFPDYPFLNVFRLKNMHRLSKEGLAFLWYLTESFAIAMAFNSNKLLAYLLDYQLGCLSGEKENFAKFLEWFLPIHVWDQLMRDSPKKHCMILFHKPSHFKKKSYGLNPGEPPRFKWDMNPAGWYDINPAGYYYKINYQDAWMETRINLAKTNQIKTEDLPPEILNGEYPWKEEDPQTVEWEKTVIEYFNNIRAFTHPPMIVQPTDPVPDPAKDNKPFNNDTLPFTIEIRDSARPN